MEIQPKGLDKIEEVMNNNNNKYIYKVITNKVSGSKLLKHFIFILYDPEAVYTPIRVRTRPYNTSILNPSISRVEEIILHII